MQVAYFVKMRNLAELAVAVELDQFVDLDIDSDHKWWPRDQRAHSLSLVITELKIPRLHAVSEAPLGWPQVQTISAGLPADPLLVDIISLFTKLTIALAGWSRSSSANT